MPDLPDRLPNSFPFLKRLPFQAIRQTYHLHQFTAFPDYVSQLIPSTCSHPRTAPAAPSHAGTDDLEGGGTARQCGQVSRSTSSWFPVELMTPEEQAEEDGLVGLAMAPSQVCEVGWHVS